MNPFQTTWGCYVQGGRHHDHHGDGGDGGDDGDVESVTEGEREYMQMSFSKNSSTRAYLMMMDTTL